MLRCPPIGGLGHVLLHYQTARRDGGGLDVLAVGPDVANMGEGEGDDLAGVRWVGQRLLIAGHPCVEADLAYRRRDCGVRTEPPPPEHRSVTKHQGGVGARW